MASGFTVFVTYQFESAPISATSSYGYTTPLHCSYFTTLTTPTLSGKAVNLFFPDDTFLAFLADSGSTNGTGFTATKLNVLVQTVEEISDSGTTVVPDPANWFKFDVTSQIPNHNVGDAILKENLVNNLYIVNFVDLVDQYDLSYLNYPSAVSGEDEMGFGEEAIFFGTVQTDIRATVYTTDIAVNLPLNEFNSTTNPTWDGVSPVSISEVGIYDDNGNLVAIGKLNYPIDKDATIARTIAFQIDF